MKIFISHSSRDNPLIREILAHLPNHIKIWIDEKNIIAGELLDETIKPVIQNEADLILLFLSKDAANSNWVKKEIKWALNREENLQYNILIPILLDDRILDSFDHLRRDLKNRLCLKCTDFTQLGVKFFAENLTIQLFNWLSERYEHPTSFPIREEESLRKEALWIRISNQKGLWQKLEQVAIKGVINGGVAAMGYYREAWGVSENLNEAVKNPSTIADLQATIAILRTIDSFLSPISRELECKISYLGEETVYKELIGKELDCGINGKILDAKDFFEKQSNTIRVIIDALDGTASFIRGFPLFCSALAILVEDQLRVSAIYDPIHHFVYSGLLPGSYNNPENFASAWAWNVAVGERENMILSNEYRENKNLKEEAIGIHLTRSNPKKLEEFLKPDSSDESILEKLAKESRGIYALNSGLFAMAEVARGALGGFVNIVTNPWDIAAGEVLIRACGGKVTDFDGNIIGYSSDSQTSVIAAKGHLHTAIKNIINTQSANQ